MNPISKTRKAQLAQYRRDRREFLAVRPWCEAHNHIFEFSQHKLAGPLVRAKDVHHKEGRNGSKLLDKSKWLPVCRQCHCWIGNHPNAARALGLIGSLGSWNTTERTKHSIIT